MRMANMMVCHFLNILDRYADKKLPQKISYAISKNISILNGEYEVYKREMAKIFRQYDEYFTKNEEGKPILNKSGLPEVLDVDKKKLFDEDIQAFVTMPIEVDIFYIDETLFDYDDDKYDNLTAKENTELRNILCDNNKKACE